MLEFAPATGNDMRLFTGAGRRWRPAAADPGAGKGSNTLRPVVSDGRLASARSAALSLAAKGIDAMAGEV